MIKAIFFDIDGTLVSFKNHKIPQSTKYALKMLRESGKKLFIATGRPASQIGFIKDIFDFDGYITINGQYCYTGNTIVHEEAIPLKDMHHFIEYLKGTEIGCSFVELDYVYFNKITPPIIDLKMKLGNTAPEEPIDNIERSLKNKTYQLSLYTDEKHETEFMRYLPGCKSVRWYPTFADIIHKNGGKMNAVNSMLNHFGISTNETMAFGDGGNDKEMLIGVGLGIAMGNASNDVKQSADFVTKNVDDDGVLSALKYLKVL